MNAQRVGSSGRGCQDRRTLSLADLLIGSLILFFASVPAPAPAQETAEELYQAGLYQEEVQGNLQSAIDLFNRIVEEFPAHRSMAANALMHIGLCHEKLGSQEAQRAYQRLIREYGDQISVVDRARVRLASLQGLTRAEASPTAPADRGIVIRNLIGGEFGVDLDVPGEPSPDGRYLASVDWGDTASNIAVLDLVTKENRLLTDHPDYDKGMAISAGFSPDGNTIAYWWFNADGSAEIRLAFRDGTPPRTLCAEGAVIYWPGPWRRDAESLIVGRKGLEGDVDIGWVSLADGAFHRIAPIPETRPRPGRFSLSPDERYLAFEFPVPEDSDRRDISMISVESGREVPIIRHPANDRVVGWVPGTHEFLFLSDRGGSADLLAVAVADGAVLGDPQVVRRDVGQMAPLGFTRDGDLYYWIYTLRSSLNVAPFDPESGLVRADAARPFLGSKAEPDWSPDGRSLTYWHKKDWPSGASDWDQVLGLSNLESGEERELATHLEVESPRWSQDGRYILALGLELDRRESDAPGFFRIDPQTGQAVELLRFPPLQNWYWEMGAAPAPNGRDIVYVRDGRLVLHESPSGNETELYRHAGITSGLIEPSSDGRRLLFAVQDLTTPGLTGTPADLRQGRVRLLAAHLPGGEIEEILALDLETGARIRNVDWGPEGRYVYFTETAGDEGTVLNRVPIAGGDPEAVWSSSKRLGGFSISPAGDRVAFTIGENQADTYVMENLKAALQEMREGR